MQDRIRLCRLEFFKKLINCAAHTTAKNDAILDSQTLHFQSIKTCFVQNTISASAKSKITIIKNFTWHFV